MTWRGFLVTLGLLVAFGLDIGLLVNENILDADRRLLPESALADPLAGMAFTPGNRRVNLNRFGFTDAETTTIVKKIELLSERWHVGGGMEDLLRLRFDDSGEPRDALIASFCGASSILPVRYGALKYLVTEDPSGMRRAVNLDAIAGIEFQDWASKARIDVVYQEVERIKDREPDATKMALAAILSGNEQTAIDGKAPWGRAFFRGWSWEDARRVQSGLPERLDDVVATLHLALESTASEGGICRP